MRAFCLVLAAACLVLAGCPQKSRPPKKKTKARSAGAPEKGGAKKGGPAGEAAGPAPPAAEPVIEGRSLSAWAADLSSEDETVRSEAIRALGDAGPGAAAAVPALIGTLERNVPTSTVTALVAIGPAAAPHLARALGEVSDAASVYVHMALDRIGPTRACIPALVEVLAGGTPRRMVATRLLARCGDAAVPRLRELESHPDADVRFLAKDTIRKIKGE